jgi:hypothetical protein
MNIIERAITAKLITTAMNAGWTVAGTDATSDGRYEAWPECMTLEQCIARAHEDRESVDDIRFFFLPPPGAERKTLCVVCMINANGNDGFDLISDHSDREDFNAAVMNPVNDWVESLTVEQFLDKERMPWVYTALMFHLEDSDWNVLATEVEATCAEAMKR